ncbi:MAG: hypothetical protein JWO33_1873 [Caulobacteraceae bacterium]|nr:hypothetical protein [Caulobacteraceae bacterium]
MRGLVLALASIGVVAIGATATAQVLAKDWRDAGEARGLEASAEYADAAGMVGVLNAGGPVDTRGHPFFEPIGANGRACVTCHQPAEAMSVSAATIARRWQETNGADPIFAAIDGSNCPSLPQKERASHSLAIERGLFRVAMPWPPRKPDGAPLDPEFTIEVVRDPTGCNTSPDYGLTGRASTVSVFRRPRMVANMKYVDTKGPVFNAKNIAMANLVDRETKQPSNMNLLSDARLLSLTHQARDTARNQLERAAPLTDDQLSRILAFERQVYVAQGRDRFGADFAAAGMPQALGPRAMLEGQAGVRDSGRTVFKSFEAWKSAAPAGEAAAFRASVARGYDIFSSRTFFIRDAMHINTTGLGNPVKGACATCHSMPMTGMAPGSGWVDVGAVNAPWANESPELTLFNITCRPDAPPHPFLGRVIYTQDPGRALISGRCMDVGAIVMGQLRGLSARAPYFSNGSAKSLRELVDFYDRRFNIRYSEAEKQDLVNFLSVL